MFTLKVKHKRFPCHVTSDNVESYSTESNSFSSTPFYIQHFDERVDLASEKIFNIALVVGSISEFLKSGLESSWFEEFKCKFTISLYFNHE